MLRFKSSVIFTHKQLQKSVTPVTPVTVYFFQKNIFLILLLYSVYAF